MLLNIFSGNVSTIEILQLVLAIPCIIIALSFHEAAHGYVAYKMGDPTAKYLGRLTLNPIKHLDLFGTLLMLLVGYGWAKPVPINTRYFKNQKKGMALSALAGPVTNLALGLIGILLYRIVALITMTDAVQSVLSNSTVYNLFFAILMLLELFSMYNFCFALFNMIPIPPFDGSRVLFAFLPDKYYFAIMKYEQYIMIALLLFLTVGPGFSVGTIALDMIYGVNRLLDLVPFLRLF